MQESFSEEHHMNASSLLSHATVTPVSSAGSFTDSSSAEELDSMNSIETNGTGQFIDINSGIPETPRKYTRKQSIPLRSARENDGPRSIIVGVPYPQFNFAIFNSATGPAVSMPAHMHNICGGRRVPWTPEAVRQPFKFVVTHAGIQPYQDIEEEASDLLALSKKSPLPCQTPVATTPHKRPLAGAESEEDGPGSAVVRRLRHGNPLNVSNMEMADQISREEVQICRYVRIPPKAYLNAKTILVEHGSKHGFFKKSAAQKLLHIDVNKTGKLYDYFTAMEWLPIQ